MSAEWRFRDWNRQRVPILATRLPKFARVQYSNGLFQYVQRNRKGEINTFWIF